MRGRLILTILLTLFRALVPCSVSFADDAFKYIQKYRSRDLQVAFGVVGRIIVRDLDNDGRKEIIAVRTEGKDFTLLSDKGIVIRRFQMIFQDLLDLNLDRKLEIAAFTSPTAHGKSLVLLEPDGKVIFRKRLLHMPDYESLRPVKTPFQIIYQDMNDDGSAEMILSSRQFDWIIVLDSQGNEIPRERLLRYLPIVMEDYDPSCSPFVMKSSSDIRGDRFYMDLFGRDHLAFYRNSLPDKWYREFPVYDDRTGKQLWVFRIDRDEAGDGYPGSFGAVETADLDGDGKNEILLGAVNRIFILDRTGKPVRIIRDIFY